MFLETSQRRARLAAYPGCHTARLKSEEVNVGKPKTRVLGFLKSKQIDFFPEGNLRWWLLGLMILGWAGEQYEALKNKGS